MKVFQRLKSSSKWQAGLFATVWVFLGPYADKVGLTEAQVYEVWLTFLVVIGAQAATDLGKERKAAG